MHADEETKHAGTGAVEYQMPLVFHPSWTRLSGCLVRQLGSRHLLSSLSLRLDVVRVWAGGWCTYKMKVKSRFVSYHFTTTMASSF